MVSMHSCINYSQHYRVTGDGQYVENSDLPCNEQLELKPRRSCDLYGQKCLESWQQLEKQAAKESLNRNNIKVDQSNVMLPVLTY